MPRQDVPYGGAICRLRERIAEIFDKLGEKLHTINGVPGDGDGNVKIVSGSSAVVISNDPTQNEIAVSLDTSQLPAAAVSSVNGQTGSVALDAGDIPTVGGDVQADLQDLANNISGNTAAINAEVLARQGADSALQTNINTVTASLPAAAAAAVAADPTVAYVASEINNKVDKITSGSSLKAYSHTGATQGETSIVDGTAANSIGIRDANGRMQAADPASGATDKTLVTANWISQTGDSAPNNVVHRSGNEYSNGLKNHQRLAGHTYCESITNGNTAILVQFARASSSQSYRTLFLLTTSTAAGLPQLDVVMFNIAVDNNTNLVTVNSSSRTNILNSNNRTFEVFVTADNKITFALKATNNMMVSCIPLTSYVGGRFGVTIDNSKQLQTVTIPADAVEVTI